MTSAKEALSSLRQMNTSYGEKYGYHSDVVRAFIQGHILAEEKELAQCPECSGVGERYYRHADAVEDCLRCGGSGIILAETL